jgi:hypothetical protein
MALNQTIQESIEQQINHIANSYTGIYGMHKYWSKKPYCLLN